MPEVLYFPNTHAQKTWVLGFYHLTYQQRYDTIHPSANGLLTNNKESNDMKIEDAIESLKKAQTSGVKSIIIAFWEASVFDRQDDAEWEKDCKFVEEDMDWSFPTEDIIEILENITPKQQGE